MNIKENEVYDIECIGEFEDEYVYDIEMEDDTNHTFFANDILIHNSCFLTFDTLMNQLNVNNTDKERLKITRLLAKIATNKLKEFNENFFPKRFNAKNSIFWDQELIARTGIWCQPKKYVCHIIEENGKPPKDDMLKKGLDMVRSSIPKLFRNEIKTAVDMILKESNETVLKKYITDLYNDFKSWNIEDITIPSSCNNLEKYQNIKDLNFLNGTPQHMRGAIAFNYYIKEYNLTQYEPIKERDKFNLIFLAKNNDFPIAVFGYKDKIPKELNLIDYVDKNKHFERGIIKPLTQIFDALKWNFPETKNIAENIDELFL